MRPLLMITLFLHLFWLSACSTLTPLNLEKPTVTVSGVELEPGEGISPNFLIKLHITNPNAVAIALQGIAYSVYIEEKPILAGVANQLPVIDGYGQADITLTARANLINGVRLLASLMNQPQPELNYRLQAKLDTGSLTGPIQVSETGQLTLP